MPGGQCQYGLGCDPSTNQCREFSSSFCGSDGDCAALTYASNVDFMCNAQHQCYQFVETKPPTGSTYCPCGGGSESPEEICANISCYNESWQDCGLATPPGLTECTEE